MFTIYAKEKPENKLLKSMRILSEIRTSLESDPIAKEICRENDIGEWFSKSVPISFEDLDVAAKTVNGNIILSKKLLSKPHEIRMRYVIHEFTHATQHVKNFGNKNNKSDKSQDYLDRDNEKDAFKKQIKYDAEERGKENVEDYVDGLLSHHDVPKSERKDKKDELMMEVE